MHEVKYKYSTVVSNPWLCFVLQAVVLFAMGGYGSYLGWQIRLSDDLVNSFWKLLFISLAPCLYTNLKECLIMMLIVWFKAQKP